MTNIIRATKVKRDDRNLTVSTVQLGFRRYDTVIFDDTTSKQYAGKTIGSYVIDHLSVRSDTRETAMDAHREALYAARTDLIR